MLGVSLRSIFMLERLCGLGSLQDSRTGNCVWDLSMEYYLRPFTLLQETLSLKHVYIYAVNKNSLSTCYGSDICSRGTESCLS